jgi:tol-pal system protein YbgF
MRFYSITTAAVMLLGGSWVSAQAVVAPVIDLNDFPDNAASSSSQDISATSDTSTASADSLSTRQGLPMEQRVRLLEQQISNLTQINLPAKVDNLEQQIHQLNGQLEEQAHTIQQLQDQLQKSASSNNVDVPATAPKAVSPAQAESAVKPIKSVTTTTVTSTVSPKENTAADKTASITLAETAIVQNKAAAPESTNAVKNEGSAEKAYQTAFDLMVKKQTMAATTAFKTFLKNYPNSVVYTPNAHYWLGELYSTAGDKAAQASREFTLLIQQYPTHAKVPDAMLKLAIIHDDAGQHAQAKQELQKVITQFPDSTAAKLAKMRLKGMKAA